MVLRRRHSETAEESQEGNLRKIANRDALRIGRYLEIIVLCGGEQLSEGVDVAAWEAYLESLSSVEESRG